MVKLPVKKMVLYKHGVGYIERRGKLKGDEVKLQFKRGNMNDVLKSLLVLDTSGKITGVSYESHEEVEEKLKNALAIPEGEGVVGLLKALTGHEVSVTAAKQYRGKIVGIEQNEQNAPKQGIVINTTSEKKDDVLALLDNSGKTHFIAIDDIKNVEIVDEGVLSDLRYFLELTAAERKLDVKAVTVHLDNNKMHDLSISYIIEMPVWRTSYRVAFDEKGSLLQGWGIMDNSLEEDLNEVDVSLVAGQPISFIYDFYAPPIAHRPTIREQARAVSAPVDMETEEGYGATEGTTEAEEDLAPHKKAKKAKMVMMPGRYAGAPAPAAAPRLQEAISTVSMAASTSVQTKTQDLGAFFRYDILNPVTIKRGESAMLPIVQQKIDCEKVFVYNRQKNPKNPMVSLRFRNKTGLTLERGPLTVYDAGMYAGEAILPFTAEEQEQYIVYAVELGVDVSSESSSNEVFKSSYVSGYYFVRVNYQKTKTTYRLNNKTKKQMKIILEHPKWTSYELVDTEKPDEETESYYRWDIDVPAGKTIEFELTQVKETRYREYIQQMTVESLESYFKHGQINQKLKEHIVKIIAKQQEIKDMEAEKANLEAERQRFLDEQERLRKNISSLPSTGKGAGLRKKYILQLDKEETRILEINARMVEIDKLTLSLQKEMNKIVEKLPDSRY